MRRVYANKALGYDPERDFDKPSPPEGVSSRGTHHQTGHDSDGTSAGSESPEQEMNENKDKVATKPKPSGEKYFE